VPYNIGTVDLNDVAPEIGLTAVMVPLVVIDFPTAALLETGSCTFTTTPVLFVKMSAIVPAVQFTSPTSCCSKQHSD
jgi:hypothetical protein